MSRLRPMFAPQAPRIVALACLLFATLVVTPAQAAVGPFAGYLMAHFTGESATGEQIYLAHSDDGLHWTDLNNGSPVLLSTVGTRGVRDPAIVRSEESRVLARWPSTPANRLQSYNFPDRYIRHYSYLLRLDPVATTAERADATFRVTS